MAGGVEVHSHIAGGNVVLSRLLLPDLYVSEAAPEGHPFAHAGGSAAWIGANYARMGYTTAVEPAMPPVSALSTQLELADIPLLDRGALCVMGNDDHLLQLLRDREGKAALRDLVALNVATSRALGVKCINAGGASAFKDGALTLSLDDEIPTYGLSTRKIMNALLDAVEEIGVPHPLTSTATISGFRARTIPSWRRGGGGRAAHPLRPRPVLRLRRRRSREPDDGRLPLGGGPHHRGHGGASERDLRRRPGGVRPDRDDLARHPAPVRRPQGRNPKKWILTAGDAEGGGVVPFLYRPRGPTSSLQWAIGLELMLLSKDPERTILTTDHPNGGPFTEYPRIIHLLMDKEARDREIATLPKVVGERSSLPEIEREYTLPRSCS